MRKRGGKTFQLGRDSETGRFMPVERARQRSRTTIVERIPKPGHGDTGRGKGGGRKKGR